MIKNHQMSIASPWWRYHWCPNHDATTRFAFMFYSYLTKRWLFFKFNYWTLCVKIGTYELSKLNVNNLQEYWTVTEKSCFKTKKSVKKSVNNRFTTDFRLFSLKNYTKNMRCCQNKNNFIYFDNGSN
jgi:hypothetical protein